MDGRESLRGDVELENGRLLVQLLFGLGDDQVKMALAVGEYQGGQQGEMNGRESLRGRVDLENGRLLVQLLFGLGDDQVEMTLAVGEREKAK